MNGWHFFTHRAKRTKTGVETHGAKPVRGVDRDAETRHTPTAQHWLSIQRALLFSTPKGKGGER